MRGGEKCPVGGARGNQKLGQNAFGLRHCDKKLLELKMFHSYNIVKKNTLANHNITKINNINF